MLTGIYGGSFNPIHYAHIRLAKALLRQTQLDEIWFVVSPQNPLKRNLALLDDDKRLELTRLALKRVPGLSVSDVEFRLPRPSYMHTTLTYLAEQHPDRQFVLIIGADNWERFHLWHRADDIIARFPIIIYPRPGSPIDANSLPPTVKLVDTPLIPISSTLIRQRIKQGKSIDRLVPRAVARIIREEGLYL